ncbi:MAG: hypothetical protein P1V97_11305 [Planctomycetota bacterium]|nr:hypothetical protein [Planctomycetota bacterium]
MAPDPARRKYWLGKAKYVEVSKVHFQRITRVKDNPSAPDSSTDQIYRSSGWSWSVSLKGPQYNLLLLSVETKNKQITPKIVDSVANQVASFCNLSVESEKTIEAKKASIAEDLYPRCEQIGKTLKAPESANMPAARSFAERLWLDDPQVEDITDIEIEQEIKRTFEWAAMVIYPRCQEVGKRLGAPEEAIKKSANDLAHIWAGKLEEIPEREIEQDMKVSMECLLP